MRLTEHFTLDELTVSQTAARKGISNRPGPDAVTNLRALCRNVLEPLRVRTGAPIIVTSGYRCPELNARIGGSATSQHCIGQAVDFTVAGLSVADTVTLIRRLGLPYDQLIDEFGQWVHVSHGPRLRKDVLTARRIAGKTVYSRIS